jgi:hypothetical protein
MPASALVELMLAGDEDAIGGFHDGNLDRVRSFCAEVCPPEAVDEAIAAAFLDLLSRIAAPGVKDSDLEELLMKSTRGAAAGRFDLQMPAGEHLPGTPDAACLAMPELMAAYANDELAGGEDGPRQHLERCTVCTLTAERLERAQQAYDAASERAASPSEWIPPAQRSEATVSEPEAEAAAAEPEATVPEPEATAPEPEPRPDPPSEAPPVALRRRRGGLVGAARKALQRSPGPPTRP